MQSGRPVTVPILLSAARSDIDDSESVIEHHYSIRDSIVASIPACHAGDRGSIPRRGE